MAALLYFATAVSGWKDSLRISVRFHTSGTVEAPMLRHKTRVNQQSFCTRRGAAVALIAAISRHTIFVLVSQLVNKFPTFYALYCSLAGW